jgi:HK97 family phage major capsid protein
MNRLEQLRKRYAQFVAELRAMLDANPNGLNAEQQAAYNAKNEERKALLLEIAREEELAAEEHRLAQITTRSEGPAGGAATSTAPATSASTAAAPDAATRAGADAILEAVRSVIRVGADREAERPFTSFGDQLFAVRAAASPGAAPDKRLLRIHEMRAASGMGEAVPSDGGFLVQTDFMNTIIGRIFDQTTGVIASRVQGIPIGPNANGIKQNAVDETSRANGSRWGGVQTYWAAEADTVAGTKPKFRPLQMDLEKLFAIWYLTEELSQDSVAAGAVAEQAFSEELQFKFEDGVINGTGVGQMLGILQSGALQTVAIEATQTIANSPQFIATNTAKMLSSFLGSRQRATWLANIEILPTLVTATLGGTNIPVYLPGGNIANAPFGTLHGIPVFFVEYASAQGTVGDIILTDLGWYLTITKGAPRFAMSMHVRFLNDENAFRVTWRVNGQPIPKSPITPHKGTTTRSPFVALAARS